MRCSCFPFRHSFSQFPGCEEPGDPRSSYSAFAVASMLDEWDSINVDQGLAFLECCRVRTGYQNLCRRESSDRASCRATKALTLNDPVSKPTVRLASPSESSAIALELTRLINSRSYLLCHRSLLSRIPTAHYSRAGRSLALARRPTGPTAATFAVRNRFGFGNRRSHDRRSSITRCTSCRCAYTDIRRRSDRFTSSYENVRRCGRLPGSGEQTDRCLLQLLEYCRDDGASRVPSRDFLLVQTGPIRFLTGLACLLTLGRFCPPAADSDPGHLA